MVRKFIAILIALNLGTTVFASTPVDTPPTNIESSIRSEPDNRLTLEKSSKRVFIVTLISSIVILIFQNVLAYIMYDPIVSLVHKVLY